VVFVPYGKRESHLLTAIPENLRVALRTEAESQNTSMTNVMGEIMCGRYGLEWSSSGRPLRSDFSGGVNLGVRLPPAVFDKIRAEAHEREVAMRSVMLTAIAEHFELEPPDETTVNPARRRGRPRAHGRPKGRGRSRT
jgi:hypothetical protein